MATVKLKNKSGTSVRRSEQVKRNKDVPASHPFNNEKNHQKLITHITDRLDMANEIREPLTNVFNEIDKELAGFQVLSKEEKKVEKKNRAGQGPIPTNVNLQLTAMQLDEELTFLLSVYSPEEGTYSAHAAKANQALANSMAALSNEHDRKFHHYRHYALGLRDMLAYNIGGFFTYWRRVIGNKVTTTSDGRPELTRGVIYEGNMVESIDMYNFLWDIAVSPIDLPANGEFFAVVERQRTFRLKKMEADGDLWGVDRFKDDFITPAKPYFRERPIVRNTAGGNVLTTNFTDILRGTGDGKSTTNGAELIHYFGWIIPSEFGLSDSKDLEIWRITMANGKHIASAEHLNVAHAMLPCGLGSPIEDGLGLQTKSYAEVLLPLQRFASFLINIHQKATRKALFGHTIYDPNVIPAELIEATDVSSKIPMRGGSPDMDIRKHILHITDSPDTSGTMVTMGNVMELMQRMLPTDIIRQIAGLDRATLYQAAATVQSSNRRSYKIAKIIDSQAMEPIRQQLMFNILQFQPVVTLINDEGDEQEINPADFRGKKIEFSLAGGLHGLDRLMIMEVLKEIIIQIIQSPTAQAEIDIVALLDYYTSQFGERTDLSQFRRKEDDKTREALLAGARGRGGAGGEQGAGRTVKLQRRGNEVTGTVGG
jgi:hypothetical protein